MTSWSLPQYLVAVFMALGFVVACVAVFAAYYAAYAYVLHAGRFW